MSACPAKYIIYSDDLVLWINELEVVALKEPGARLLQLGDFTQNVMNGLQRCLLDQADASPSGASMTTRVP